MVARHCVLFTHFPLVDLHLTVDLEKHKNELPFVVAATLRVASCAMNTKFPYVLANGKLAPPHRGKFFEVMSRPIKTTYSEVYWTQQDPIPLPADFVKRYAGKTVGFVGYEADVIRRCFKVLANMLQCLATNSTIITTQSRCWETRRNLLLLAAKLIWTNVILWLIDMHHNGKHKCYPKPTRTVQFQ